MGQADSKRFGEFRLDPVDHALYRNETRVPINRRAFDVLDYLASRPGRVISKEELLQHIWGDANVDENNLSQSISALRKALDQRADETGFIMTLAGRGYQFTARVEDEPAMIAARSQALGERLLLQRRSVRSSSSTQAHRVGGPTAFPWLFVVLGLLLLVAGYGAWRWSHPAVASAGTRLVLEPFQNATGDMQFDHTLGNALQIDLEESPFVSLLSPSQVESTLADMQHKDSDALTHPLAVEVCERNNAQATLQGTIVRLGKSFVLTFEAASCVTGKRLAASKIEVEGKDDVLQALDKGADSIRRQLGESTASLERYETPIMVATTPSLDALRSYSLGQESFQRGDMPGAQLLFERAVALDPNFAAAYMALATTFYNRGDSERATKFYTLAYERRAHVSEGERLTIESVYFANAVGDYEEAIRRIKQFVLIYPNSDTAWITLTNTYTELGEYPQAVEAGENAVRDDPHSGISAEVLARAYQRANRFADAKRVARQSIAAGKDHWGTHSILFQIAAFEHDNATVQSETAWMMAHPPLSFTYDDLGFAATLWGKLHEGLDDFKRASVEFQRNGDPTNAQLQQLNLARFQLLAGETDQARASLQQMSGDGGDLQDKVLFQARTGDLAPAKRFVANAGKPGETDTPSVFIGVPLAAAEVALQEHHPLDAIRALQPAKPYELNSFDILDLRARAETEAGQLAAAEADYRLALAHPGIDSVAAEYWLAHLSLARVLVLQHNTAAARAEYQTFLAGWSDADPDLPVLKAAKAELARLPIG
jgi:DNA-binding winged helix-turn-helix (wHTH) protein/tetratricopeptide (TPR) repeat protein